MSIWLLQTYSKNVRLVMCGCLTHSSDRSAQLNTHYTSILYLGYLVATQPLTQYIIL